ncbi:MAG TPA: hypothetical protein VM535_00810, partial [Candidatus Saccharimonadales bacterium]|nr:hypothetical protein [Candidatus Saccharimonadales bacterium]
FRSVSDDCIGLKVYLAETTGGNNIAVEYGAEVARLWHTANPEKPVVFHVEGADTARLLNNIGNLQGSPDATGGRMNIGRNIPVHIAHVSSRQEMQAVIDAKQAGLNVTCEVTPHHLFLNESIPEEIGGYGCMKPNLKSQADVDFLWTHMGDIDIFASDCAPHRISDKEKDQPAFGVTNHTIMLPLLLGAVADDRLSMADIDRKFCVTPRERFNLPLDDGSLLSISTDPSTYQLTATERDERAEYGQNPFTLLEGRFRMLGRIVAAQAGRSIVMADHGSDLLVGYMKTSYTHQLRPKNFKTGRAE